MKNNVQTIKGALLGILATLLFIAVIGAVNQNTPNKAGDTTTSFKSVYASSDGRTVYVCDNNTVYRSNDGGADWVVVLKKSDTTGF